MRPTVLGPLFAVLVLGGCSLSRAGPLDTPTRPVQSKPARALHDTSNEPRAVRDLAALGTVDTWRTAAAAIDRRTLAAAFRPPVAAPKVDEADPIRGAFDALPAGHRWMPEEFLPSGGTLDLTRLGRGRLHVRAWNQDEGFRGGGLGMTVPLRSGWHVSAEIGVDPQRSPYRGGVAVVAGFGLRL